MFVRKFQEKSIQPLKKWYNSPIKADNDFIVENGKKKTHGDFIETLAGDLSQILEKYSYFIENKEAFFNELIQIIYKVSDNS